MKEVIWVFGIGGVGKETFIRKVIDSKTLRKQLGWKNKKVAASQGSFEAVDNITRIYYNIF